MLYNDRVPSHEQLKALGALVRDARKDKGWTLEELEEHSGVNKSYLWIIESGYVAPKRSPTVPSDDILSAVADALGISVSKLHGALGRVPELAVLERIKADPEAARIAKAFSNAPDELKRAMLGIADAVLGDSEK